MSELDKQETEFCKLLRQAPFDDTPHPQHCDELREAVLHEFDLVADRQKLLPSKLSFPESWRQMMRRPLPRLVAVSVVCLSLATPWLFFPAQQSKAFGFNNFASAIVEAKTAKFQIESSLEGFPTQKSQGYYLAPGRFRMEMSALGVGSTIVSDDATGKMMTLMPAMKTAMFVTGKGQRKDQPPNNPFIRFRQLLTENQNAKANPFKPIGEKEIDGKKLLGFQSQTPLGQFTLWGDPVTGHPVRVESEFSGDKRNITVMSDIEINVELDEKLFEMTPPDDYKTQSVEIDLSKPGEKDFVDALKLCTEISDGKLPDSLGLLSMTIFISSHSAKRLKNASPEELQKSMAEMSPIARGFRFALELPESAEAYYAGKNVTHGDADKPLFWYKPKDSTTYRVIYADFSIKESATSPQVPSAERLFKTNKATKP